MAQIKTRNKITILVSVYIVISACSTFAVAVKVLPGNAMVRFEIQYLKFFKVMGCFNDVYGGLTLEDTTSRLLAIKGDIVIASLYTGIAFRDEQLKSESYFNQLQFPGIHFESGTITYINDSEFEIVGTIMIKGITKPIQFYGRTDRFNSESGKGRKIVHLASGVVDRQQFNIGPVEFYYPDGLLISRKVLFSIHTEICLDENGNESACPAGTDGISPLLICR